MSTMKKIIVFSSIVFLAGGLLIGCDREEQAVMDQPQEREEAATEQRTEAQEQAATEPMEQQDAEPLEEGEEATSAEIRGETERMAAGGTQAGQGLIGKTVTSNDDRELGEVAELEATGQRTGYVFIQGEDDEMHPVPANLLEDSPDGQGLRAKFDQSAFEQAPSFSESEVRNISDSQLEEVRGYYEEQVNR